MKPPRWAADATDPGDGEVETWLDGADPLRALGSSATEPLDDELQRLLRRPVPAPRRPIPLAAPLLLVGTAAAAAWFLAPRPAAVVAPADAALAEVPADVRFTAEGAGDWAIARHDPAGLVVEQTAGTVLYRVQPLPDGASLVVDADGLEVEVVGTVFEVGTNGGDAWVTVYEGKVAIHDGGDARLLVAGDSWERRPAELVVPPRPTRKAPEPVLPTGPDAAVEYAALLRRFEEGDRGEELRTALWAFAAAHDSPLGVDARAVALQLAAAGQDPRAVISAIQAFLDANPETPRLPVLLEIQATLAKDKLHDCATAIPLYRRLAVESEGVTRGRAEAWEGLCAAGLADPEALAILLASLRDGVDGRLQDEVKAAVDRLASP